MPLLAPFCAKFRTGVLAIETVDDIGEQNDILVLHEGRRRHTQYVHC